jgi:hypothetical protein
MEGKEARIVAGEARTEGKEARIAAREARMEGKEARIVAGKRGRSKSWRLSSPSWPGW